MILIKGNIKNNRKDIFPYVVWGFASTIINIGVFRLFIFFEINYQFANIATLLIVKIFSYVTNKIFVFRTPYKGFWPFLKEVSAFFLARGLTFIVDFLGVVVMVEFMGCDAFLSKCILAVLVICLNYVLSKRFVFQREKGVE